MTSIKEIYKSPYISAKEFQPGKEYPATIQKVSARTFDERGVKKQKLLLWFVPPQGAKENRPVILSQKAAEDIADALSNDDFEKWAGGKIVAYRVDGTYGANNYSTIRFKKAA